MSNHFEKFTENVISKGVNAVIPRNLSDYWLRYLLIQIHKLKNDQNDSDLESISSAVALILESQKGQKLTELSDSELEKYASEYCTELQLEAVHRNTEFQISAATSENILSSRHTEITKKKYR